MKEAWNMTHVLKALASLGHHLRIRTATCHMHDLQEEWIILLEELLN